MSRETHKWRAVKAKITVRFGTVSAAAAALECSSEGIRQAVRGKCPGIARKLRAEQLMVA